MKTLLKFIIEQTQKRDLNANPDSKIKKTVVSTNLIMGILVYLFQLKNVWKDSETKPIQQKLLLFKTITAFSKELFGMNYKNKIALIKSFIFKSNKTNESNPDYK